MQIPEELRYADNHEWAKLEDDGSVRVGISDYAQDALGDIVYIDLPEVGATVGEGDAFGEIESTKSVAEIYAPVAGTITEVNDALDAAPEAINHQPYGAGWIVVITPATDVSLDHLMEAEAYAAYTEEG
ncbi:MAG: glycine cleavage system protein GcvH [Acidimicrobiia bacterium]|nr:glycine cleavage system protein GcvH [Acidimicrobiia bacterium]